MEALRYLVPFVQRKKREKHPWSSSTPPRVFFMFLKFSPILNRSQTHQKNSVDKSTDQENLFSIIKKVIFFNSNTSVQSCPNPLFQTQRLLFLLALYFMEYLKIQVRTNKMVNEHKVKCHPSPSGFS